MVNEQNVQKHFKSMNDRCLYRIYVLTEFRSANIVGDRNDCSGKELERVSIIS